MPLPSNPSYSSSASGLDDAVMPVAIIGVSGRFPGDATNPKKLWDLVAEKRSALTEIPKDRFNIDAYYHPHNERQGTMNVRKAHFMSSDVSVFDAPFFNMPIAEAKAMDPQQRMALECTYEALENAGVRMEQVQGSDTACFVGTFGRDYGDMHSPDPEDLPLYNATGTGAAMMSNRISWFFDMKGPSISLDTACSSSMAALHLACQSLRTGESKMAVVGGTSLILVPATMSAMSGLHFLSPDGKSQSFDHKGNGYSRGEGVAFCVVKPLHLALEDGDVIRGVIRNTGVNQDGHTPGITLPSAEAQEQLIRRVYKEAGLGMADTTYVEAHGTGTPAGDPVEAGALGITLGQARKQAGAGPLIIGSIKSNIGHLEGASGMAQIVKAIMMLEKGQIPGVYYYEKPNPRIPLDQWNLQIPTELIPWPHRGLRRISISSFGYGGTNAHCILDDAYHYLQARRLVGNHNVQIAEDPSPATPSSAGDSGIMVSRGVPSVVDQLTVTHPAWKSLSEYSIDGATYPFTPVHANTPKLLVWTSHEQAGIARTSNMYGSYLSSKLDEDTFSKEKDSKLLSKFSRTLASRRSVLAWKSFAIAGNCTEATTQLLQDTPANPPLRSANSKKPPRIGLVFTGQGAQWYAMGRELFAHPIFRESLEAASGFFARMGASWSLISELWAEESASRLSSADLSQPICSALQVALIDLLRLWGVKYNAVVGHSSGEIAAAYAKGAITRQDAWTIAYHRGHLSACIKGFAPKLEGAMLATGLGPDDAEKYISRLEGQGHGNAVVACVNSPSSTTLSGDSSAISQLEKNIKADGHFARKLLVDVAYHSPHMEVIAAKYRQALANMAPLPEKSASDEDEIQMFSSLTGKQVDNAALGPDYWVANMTGQVNFSGAVQQLMGISETDASGKPRRVKKLSVQHLVEVGPHAALKGPLKQILNHPEARVKKMLDEVTYDSVIVRGQHAVESALKVAGRLFQFGLPIDINAVNCDTSGASGGFLVDLPAFSWNHTLSYWFESHGAKTWRFRKHPRTDLLGTETLEMLPEEPRFRNILRVADVPWVAHHKVQGTILYPAAGMMIMAIQAACQKATDDFPDKTIKGYELRDVIIGKAIVVPQDEDGVELVCSMKPFRLGSQALTSVWQEFQLYSRKEVWELNCSGLIRVQFDTGAANPLFADEHSIASKDLAAGYRRVQGECPRSQSPLQFYQNLNAIGLQYGPSFQNLATIHKGDWQSICDVRIPDTAATMPCNFEFPHVIHPATLDSIIHVALAAWSEVDTDLRQAMVPTSIGRLYVSAKIPSKPGVVLPSYAIGVKVESGNREGFIAVGNEDFSEPLVQFDGFRTTMLEIPTTGDPTLRKLTNQIHWQEDISLLEPAQVKAACLQTVGDAGLVERSVIRDLEVASLIIIKRVMKQCSATEAQTFERNFRLYWEYMRRCYERGKAGLLCYQDLEGSANGVPAWMDMNGAAEAALLGRVAATSTDGKILVEHGKYLAQILRSEVSPLQILADNNLMDDYYQSGVSLKRHYAHMAAYVNMMAHKNPNMNILEIGAGTGAATMSLLESLGGNHGTHPRFKSYTFTDVNGDLLARAEDKFATWGSFMSYSSLDIEQDPTQQGFSGEYDLVIASDVLRATKSITQSLKNANKLLKPGGKIVISEITNPSKKMRFQMMFGSLEGWFHAEEDGRLLEPTINTDAWNERLLEAKFDGVELQLGDAEDARDLGFSVMVSGASKPEAVPAPKEALLVLPARPSPAMKSFAEMLSSKLKSHGTAAVKALGLAEAARQTGLEEKSCLVLVDAFQEAAFLMGVSEKDWEDLRTLALACRDTTYVTCGAAVNSENPAGSLMTGLGRCIRSETPGLAFATLDLEYTRAIDTREAVDAVYKVFATVGASKGSENPEWEFAVRNGRPMVQRVLLDKAMNDLIMTYNTQPKPQPAPFKQEGRPLKLEVGTPGRLDTLRFNDDPLAAEPLAAGQVEIEVKASGVNFKEVMVAMGQLQQPGLGFDCSGVVTRVGSDVRSLVPGDRVMTWKLGTYANFVRADEAMAQRIPPGTDFVTAASLPLIYFTAHYGLSWMARLKAGETILIHGAAGGVGQAAIMLAQRIGAIVYATVSSEHKKAIIMEKYGIPAERIFSSRDLTFEQGIMRLTDGRGVDVVLNSLAGEALRVSWRLVARFGRFVEIGQKDIVGNTGLDMAPFLRNATFHGCNALDLLERDPVTSATLFAEVLELIHSGVAKPVYPITAMPYSEIEQAFRLMQMGKHVGKLVLEVGARDIVPVIPASAPPARFSADATYLISGGGGGLGRSIAEWMVKCGAKNILALSPSGDSKADVRSLIEKLTAQGIRIAAWKCDVSDEAQLRAVLKRCEAEGWPRFRGVIQGAMVLRDSIYANMSHTQYMESIRPKVQGSWNMHKMLPADLDFYVMLSSMSGIAGSRGQGNYAAGNTFMDALAHHRRGLGQNACAIDVGVVLGVGVVAEQSASSRVNQNIKTWNFIGIREEELLAMVQAGITGVSMPGAPRVAPQLVTGLGTGGMMAQAAENYPWWFNDMKFAHLTKVDLHRVGSAGGKGEDSVGVRELLGKSGSAEEAADIVTAALSKKLAKAMIMSADDIEPSRPVSSYGIDSLLAVELRAWVYSELQAEVSLFDLLSNIALSTLAQKIVAGSSAVPEKYRGSK